MVSNKVLSDLARVRAGQTFRGKADDPEKASGVKLIQIKDIREVGADFTNIPFAAIEQSKVGDNLLQDGDILIPLRGGRFEAMVCYGVDDIPTITINQVAVIRVIPEIIRVEYLLWYLNSEIGRSRLSSYRVGSVQTHIGLKDLAGFNIPVPDFYVQDKVSKIYNNWLRRKKVLEQLVVNGSDLAEQVCLDMVEGI
ncbi:restriction endonuclease subunit M [Pseudomonas sp. HMWF032]|uniref:restriction endonuclease subunit S n=1 Tax=Pseudomonas sp. HMWF032 TaxID=2056866 RepID=UPI000D3A1EA7|nr:restriction endonuclease subunit S [Pseudomonas sp. HMWF032]PTS86767.1 restriction endonuclease subunit M [Pseudomonas sp. HMWF032]PTT78530.1 restriction endonuclease subunit M [Pseudomonas sp. HMWF010]